MDLGEAPPQVVRVDLVETLAHPRVRGRPRDTEQLAQTRGHHRILATAHLAVETQERLHLEGEHGEAPAAGIDRIGKAVETLSRHAGHPGHREMLSEGF
ncbi:MAG: hypothetical protein OXD29_13865 [Roseovarius sp.]|nr:hypothetical protein [Roseovarius sp.]MCY4209015.1 hypothetical protein [Roseovarius sp.]